MTEQALKPNVPEVKLRDLVTRFHEKMQASIRINPTFLMEAPEQPDPVNGEEPFLELAPQPFRTIAEMKREMPRTTRLVENHLMSEAQSICYEFAREAAVSRVLMTKRELDEIMELDQISMRRWVAYFRKHVEPYGLEDIPVRLNDLVSKHAASRKRTTWNELLAFVTRTCGVPMRDARVIIPRR